MIILILWKLYERTDSTDMTYVVWTISEAVLCGGGHNITYYLPRSEEAFIS